MKNKHIVLLGLGVLAFYLWNKRKKSQVASTTDSSMSTTDTKTVVDNTTSDAEFQTKQDVVGEVVEKNIPEIDGTGGFKPAVTLEDAIVS